MSFQKIFIFFLILSVSTLCYSQFAGGSGTVDDPYQIATAEQLNQVRYYLTSSFIQTADIDLGVAPWNEGAGWNPIGDYDPWNPTTSFRGNFNGQNFNISNMNIYRLDESDLGLFGSILGCKINNIRLMNFLIASERGYIGGISAMAYENEVSGCYSEGKISGYSTIGLLFGFFEQNSITDCHVKGEIKGTGSSIGGLVGLCSITDVISDCTADVKLYTDRLSIGGIIGQAVAINMFSKNSSKCEITAAGEASGCSGGLIGSLTSAQRNCIISECYSTGYVDAQKDVATGGLIGELYISTDSVLIFNSYSNVNVQGNKAVGGFIGFIRKNTIIKNCYSTGKVTGNSDVGGFIGKIDTLNTVSAINSYWNTETSGQLNSLLAEGRTTSEMSLPYSSNTYVDWDFETVWADDIFNLNAGYPMLKWACGIEEDEDEFIAGDKGFELYQNYPNPFNPVTKISYYLKKDDCIRLSVYNAEGQLIKLLVNGNIESGSHAVEFNAGDHNSGIYFYRLEIGNKVQSRKMLLLK